MSDDYLKSVKGKISDVPIESECEYLWDIKTYVILRGKQEWVIQIVPEITGLYFGMVEIRFFSSTDFEDDSIESG